MLNIPVRVRHLVERTCSSDPYSIAKDLRCEIIVCDLPDRVNGMWRRILRRKYIFINEHLEEWQQEAVICHELAHIIMHPTYRAFSMHGESFACQRKEREANEFADLLMSYRYSRDEVYVYRFLTESWRNQ